jgi:hypothetical protein
MGILKRKDAAKRKAFSVKIDGSLHEELKGLQVEAEAAGLVFDVAEVVEKALFAAAKSARAELDEVNK